ncbi:MAG: cryptochrome/photolyase family protein [Chloroflexota bacterium]
MNNDKRVLIWILGDQLLKAHPAIEQAKYGYGKDQMRIVLIESANRNRKLPYQRKKIVLLMSAMRHYVQRLQNDGYDAHCIPAATFTEGLRQAAGDYDPDLVLTMEAADYPGRKYQQEKLADVVGCEVELLPNTQFITSQFNPYADADPDKNVVMEHFYRKLRQHHNVLMDDSDNPTGGEWNYDKDNREKLPKQANPPQIPVYEPDEITRGVMDEVAEYEHAVGSVDGFALAVTHEGAEAAFETFVQERFEKFGPYEDAMGENHVYLWHSVLSPYINIGLLDPMTLVRRAEEAYRDGLAPINSVEGFIRQILGWREFMYWQYWRLMPDLEGSNAWDTQRPMPQMFWDGGQTKMNCIHHVAQRAMQHGYTHHIERLMIVTNFCTLAGIEPQAVTDWFKAFYIDAYDWVMQTNVVGMGLNADGGVIATKPYISSANYINKMGDYCKGCAFDRKKRHGEDACPFNFLYWNFLLEHEDTLRSNPRSGRNVLGLRHLDEDDREGVRRDAAAFMDGLDYYEV